MVARGTIAGALLGLFASAACGREPAVPAPAAAAAPAPAAAATAAEPSLAPTTASIRALVQTLSSDEMQGRGPGTPGAARAVETIVAQMQALGLQPAGDDGGWTQRVPMRAVTTDPARVELALLAGGERATLGFGEDFVGTSLRAAGTHRIDAPLWFVGHGITAPEQGWDDYAGVDVDGAIVVVLVGDPPLTDGRFAGDTLTYYGRWSYKVERAIAAGARGVLLVHETEAASYGWNVVRNSWSEERFDVIDPAQPAAAALAVEGWLSKDAADALAHRCGASLQQWHDAALAPGFHAVPLPATLVGSLVTTERRIADVNVVGRLAGARAPDEALVLTAHWDHLGRNDHAEPGADAIFNGAIDNASGVAGLLAVAAELQVRSRGGRPLGRSVYFVATTGEEQGLLGSRWFAAHPPVAIENLVAAFNLDSMNVDGRTRTVQVIGPGQSTLEDVLAEVVQAEGRAVVPDEHPESGGYFRSDHFSFAQRGVPAIYLRGGSDMADGGSERGRALGEQRARHYHTVDDEFDEHWSFEGTLQDVHTMASLVGRVADEPARPTWKASRAVIPVVAATPEPQPTRDGGR